MCLQLSRPRRYACRLQQDGRLRSHDRAGRRKSLPMIEPTPQAVTDAPCRCGFVFRSAAAPDGPIKHDPELEEYYFEHKIPDGSIARLIIYHCPLCGGVVSRSLRPARFQQVSETEVTRLQKLIRGISTAADIEGVLGKPDTDEAFIPPAGMGLLKPGTDEPEQGPIRAITYMRLSETADVQFLVFSNQEVQSVIIPKPRASS